MSRLDTTPITQQDIESYLTKTEDDFLLEWEVYQSCKVKGLTSLHGGTYEDPVTKKTRQFDVRAWRTRDNRKLQMAIECKCLKPFYPLVILQTERTKEESYHEIVHSREPSEQVTLGLETAKSGRVERENKFYEVGKFVGKSTTRVGRSANTKDFMGDDSEVFDKWSQALSSAHDLIVNSTAYSERYVQPDFFAVTLSVLVVSDGTLWVSNFRQDGKRAAAKRTDEATIFVGKEYWTGPMGVAHTISHLHIFTLKGFKRFIDRVVADDDPNEYIWHELFPREKLQELIDREGE
jgi:hypothetical protein